MQRDTFLFDQPLCYLDYHQALNHYIDIAPVEEKGSISGRQLQHRRTAEQNGQAHRKGRYDLNDFLGE